MFLGVKSCARLWFELAVVLLGVFDAAKNQTTVMPRLTGIG